MPVPATEPGAAPSSADVPGMAFHELLLRRPLAALHLIPSSAVLFTCGAIAGGLGKSLTAPVDRIRITFQVRGGLQTGTIKSAVEAGDPMRAFLAIGRQEGLLGYWKGNATVLLRILPFSAVQLLSYEGFKTAFRGTDEALTVPRRLCAGACAGMAATLATYPLDTLRLRLTVDPALKTIGGAARQLMREGGMRAFYRGLGPCMIGIAPYMALELGTFDLLPPEVPSFARGFAAALFAASLTYPLDTVRRQIQLKAAVGLGFKEGLDATVKGVGWRGLYAGFVPSALANVPNKGVRLAIFDAAKKLLVTAEGAYVAERNVHRARVQVGGQRLSDVLEAGVRPLQMLPLPASR